MTDQLALAFDYTALDPDTRYTVKAAADRIHALERKTGESIIEIGNHLIAVKDALPHGQFEVWIEGEFGWGQDTARRFMKVAVVFGQNTQIASFQPSALYALASGNVPDEIREEFIARAEAGESVRHRDVQAAIAATKPTPPPEPEPDEDDEEPIGEPCESFADAVGDGVIVSHTVIETPAEPTPIGHPRNAAEWVETLSPEGQANVREFDQAFAEGVLPGVLAQDVTRAYAAAYRALRLFKRVKVDALRQMTQESPDLAAAMREGLDAGNELAAICRAALSADDAGIRRVV